MYQKNAVKKNQAIHDLHIHKRNITICSFFILKIKLFYNQTSFTLVKNNNRIFSKKEGWKWKERS